MRQLVHLVEGDPTVRAMLTRLLESGGYAVRQYESGGEFPESANTLDEGSILLDVNMAEPDGYAVQKELRHRAVDLPAMMMSGSGDLTVPAMKARVADFVQKPFGRRELLAVDDELTAPAQRRA